MIAVLTVVDSFLLSKPNLLGKIGLVIYKYHYLRTWPRTFLTVSIVMVITLGATYLIHLLVKKEIFKRDTASIIFIALILASVAALVKTGLDFSTWSYSHTGHRFKYGAYLLPLMLVSIFVHELITLPKIPKPFPLLPMNDELKKTQSTDVDSKS
ncbi:hypothetical protein BH09BAC3_BH09BAC3_15720 [soil metagenome]